ncbi:uncharacterized protein LOC107824229 [Nicotiana tabacum]|uniref:Uncharacterized protein LOC107824229 n=1 Tax=Nicotiana tabacum TaxID=4097 RepID=A0A1S4CZ74_TOBAC|nr:PREDICTED: uncharacterized protein LOC107824229 [Nicotiana tabacum]
MATQNVLVMRHGDRLDNFEELWVMKADRPWDPPLHQDGKIRPFCTGQKIRSNMDFPIHRVFVSPFLRCVQTAAEVVRALCDVADHNCEANVLSSNSESVVIDPSKIKVSIEYGLCEMLNLVAIRSNAAPKDGDFKFNISQYEAELPAGTVDHTVEPVYKKLPEWQETLESARARYVEVVKALADKYPSENLLLVTHGEGVGSIFTELNKDATVLEVEYCGHVLAKRTIQFGENQSFTAGEFVYEKQTGILSAAK